MKTATGVLSALAFLLILQPAHAQFADAIGAYKVAKDQPCRSSEFMGQLTEDGRIGDVCIPASSFAYQDSSLVPLAIAELTDPGLLESLLSQRVIASLPVQEAYAMEVDDHDGKIYDLTDGTIVRVTESKYVGYIGWHEEAILYRQSGNWFFCVSGTHFKAEVLRGGSRSYNRDRISASEKEIKAMDACD